jgi:sulfite reductase (NADPH) hemoprotein beta-component
MSEKLSAVEKIKEESRGLRGTLADSLNNELTGAITEDDQAVIKFHGIYQQDNRDRRDERAQKKLERDYNFMIRLRLPGGVVNSAQWLAINEIANNHSTGIIKITTRQTLQLHGIIKSHLKPTIQGFNLAKLDSIATCGDINRNVVCAAHPMQSPIHAQIHAYADKISTMLMPKTRAYYEIWLDEEQLLDKKEEEDPLYKTTYLPRKFKIAIAIPPNNDVDVLANDLGLIAVVENGVLKGFNIVAGGGMSMTHGNDATYPRIASDICFCETEEETLKTVYEIVTIQRDYGNRSDRKLARLKYTLDKYGLEWFKNELSTRTGTTLKPTVPYLLTQRTDYYGWQQNHEGKWYYTVFVEHGRVCDENNLQMKTCMLEIAKTGKVNFRFTCNQNLIVSDVDAKDKEAVDALLEKYGLKKHTESSSALRRNSVACVALPNCPLAFAEGQRYLPVLVSKLEPILHKHNLSSQEIVIRMTGCPNGCARPYLAEIALIGVSSGIYNLHIGGDVQGQRLNKIYKHNVDEAGIIAALEPVFASYSNERNPNESFGDFVVRKELVQQII